MSETQLILQIIEQLQDRDYTTTKDTAIGLYFLRMSRPKNSTLRDLIGVIGNERERSFTIYKKKDFKKTDELEDYTFFF